MVNHSRAESLLFHQDDDGVDRFDALICADGKQVHGDLLLLSCGVGARTELAQLAGLPVSPGILVDENLQCWTDERIYAIGDCAQVAAAPRVGDLTALPAGGPSGLIGPGWRQADWLAARFIAEVLGRPETAALAASVSAVVMLKADGIDVVSVGNTSADPWDLSVDDHAAGCASSPLRASQWADREAGRYVKMVTRDGILGGFVYVGMPRTAVELTLLFARGSELPFDRSVLLRYDGPDYEPEAGSAFARDVTVCWCNEVTGGTIVDSAEAGSTTVACIGAVTRAGTGCGGCTARIGDVLERFAAATAASAT
ncbi:(2Fe-2S)-binding protein [Cryobacterium sp. Y62]|uniref:(2Fe-2S)-binding protein n=1 Tax=Cryobacterium sp. Y62 TaxID=2048284 RepID=UPI000CE3CBE9|nr:(2Fe-2S)-binding protein [Cryobacterium sp. Y62]